MANPFIGDWHPGRTVGLYQHKFFTRPRRGAAGTARLVKPDDFQPLPKT
jgi:hypothetical protein